jgi:hypothetical protein
LVVRRGLLLLRPELITLAPVAVLTKVALAVALVVLPVPLARPATAAPVVHLLEQLPAAEALPARVEAAEAPVLMGMILKAARVEAAALILALAALQLERAE